MNRLRIAAWFIIFTKAMTGAPAVNVGPFDTQAQCAAVLTLILEKVKTEGFVGFCEEKGA